MMGGVLEYYRHMFTPLYIEVAQTKFASTWILYTPISKVAQFKIATILFEQNIVASYARVDFCILFMLWKIISSETCLSSFLTSCKIIVKGISESFEQADSEILHWRLSFPAISQVCFTSPAEQQIEFFWHDMIIHNRYSCITN